MLVVVMVDQSIRNNLNLQGVMQANVPILFDMHIAGVPLGPADPEQNVLLFKEKAWRARLFKLRRELYDLAGCEFNLDSHGEKGQMGQFLYGKLGLPKVRDGGRIDGKIVTNKYAICFTHYNTQKEARYSPDEKRYFDVIFKKIIEIRKLSKAYSMFVAKLLVLDECDECRKESGKKFKCQKCGGTGYGEVLGFDPRYVSIRDGIVYVHPTFLQNQLTLRIGCLDPNLQTWARGNDSYKIYVRDMLVSRPGTVFVHTDISKAERRFAAIFFKVAAMLEEVERGHAAVSEFAQDAIGLLPSQTAKGTEGYNNAKTILYATQYLGGGVTVHEKLMESYSFFPIPKCWEMVNKVWEKYGGYYRAVYEGAWEALRRGYWSTYHGQRMRAERPYELDGYRSMQDFMGNRRTAAAQRRVNTAKRAFDNFAAIYASTNIQGAATGMHTQIALLRATREIEKRPALKKAGARICMVWHDAFLGIAPEECKDEMREIQEQALEQFEDTTPYLEPLPEYCDLRFGMRTETKFYRQLEVDIPDGVEDTTEKSNPGLFYRDGILFRAQ